MKFVIVNIDPKIRKPKIISISNQIIKNILIKYFRYQPIIRCKIKKKKNNKKADITKRKEKKKNNRVNQWQDWIFPICSKSHHGTKSIRAITLTYQEACVFYVSTIQDRSSRVVSGYQRLVRWQGTINGHRWLKRLAVSTPRGFLLSRSRVLAQ